MRNELIKHAYLILYHKNSAQLIKLLHALDDERNDIYIHADKKAKDFPQVEIQRAVSKSNVYFTKRINVGWGDISLINAMLMLLKEASSKGKYKYYHLLSGQDLPIKSQEYIHQYFHDRFGSEFIRPGTCINASNTIRERISLYHIFHKHTRKSGFVFRLLRFADRQVLSIQRKLHVNRIRGKEELFYKGSFWFSITDACVSYILQQEQRYIKYFSCAFCSDEIFVPSIVMNSSFQQRLYPNARLIDWKRGTASHPYVFTKEDFDLLAKSDCLFARKFDSEVDPEIIEKVIKELCLSSEANNKKPERPYGQQGAIISSCAETK